MALLCFLLDLRSIPPHLLRDLKQYLLQLANLYAVSCGRAKGERSREKAPQLRDRIGLCYLHQSRATPSACELKIAYKPGENFSLRDVHHAIHNLPLDSFLPEFNEFVISGSACKDLPLADLLNNKALYAWGGEDILKKLVAISSSVFTYTDSLRRFLMDAAERYVTVEFVVLEQEQVTLHADVSENINEFISCINEHENCVLRRYFPDTCVLCGLVKGWLQELKSEAEEQLQAVFLFKNPVLGSVNKIYCNLFATSHQIIDGFPPCQTCRCHGIPFDIAFNNNTKRSCSVTCCELGKSDILENAVSVGEQTILFLPCFSGCPKLQQVSAPITFNVMERTSLVSLNEGVVLGTSYIVTPSACHEMEAASDGYDKSELNNQLFHGLCGALFLLDEGLVCSSTCNTETMLDGTFQCFYVLQPSDKGPMLLRMQRLAGSEEILSIPDMGQSNDLAIPSEIENSIQASLSKIELRDYSPLQHERGFHPKLNWLVKESLQFGSIPSRRAETSPTVDRPPQLQASLVQQPCTQAFEEEIHGNQNEEEKRASCVAEEWEQLLIIDEMSYSDSPICIAKHKLHTSTILAQRKPLDENTSRILERLEVPKQQKPKTTSPSISSKLFSGQMKKPSLPFDSSSGQPLKPNFQRLKRKQR